MGYKIRNKSLNGLKLILSFSGAFLLGVIIFHLMPEVFLRLIINQDFGLLVESYYKYF